MNPMTKLDKDAPSFDVHFLRSWLRKQESYLRRLSNTPRGPAYEPDQLLLVAEVMAHQHAFFAAMSDLTCCDAVVALFPPWLRPEALAGVWMGGWRPVAAVRLAINMAESSFKLPALQSVREKIREEEDRIERDMEAVQIHAVEAFVGTGRGEAALEATKNLLKEVTAGIEKVANAADELRMEALRSVVEVLDPLQSLDFLAAVGSLQLSLYRST